MVKYIPYIDEINNTILVKLRPAYKSSSEKSECLSKSGNTNITFKEIKIL